MDSNHTREIAPPLRVLIADAVGEELSGMLEEFDDIEVVGCAKKAIEALILVEKLQPDVVLMDIEMPGETLASVLRLMKLAPRAPQVLILIPYSSLVLRERCLDAGADRVFTRTADLDRLVEALLKLSRKKQSN